MDRCGTSFTLKVKEVLLEQLSSCLHLEVLFVDDDLSY